MYLKRLEIKGFKSFADITEINFKPGINIIVGPNGCGKSNVVDAIRWVIGEGNIRHLRGQKSEDVIFNGTDDKKAQGMAHVEMLLDNSDQILPLDYNEITLARKVFRSGESEFYINKSRVRMKDISDLFTGTGLGKKGYSIIGQGELEQVLSGQALDRRLILEEASGTIKYRQQRDEVKRRLENTGNDLLRLGDIISEVRERKEELQYKAERARLYLQLNQECQELESEVLSSELSRGQQELNRKREDFLQRERETDLLSQELLGLEQWLVEEENRLKEQHRQLNNLQEQEYQVQTNLNSLQGELRLSAERLKNRHERIKQCRADEEKYSRMLDRLNQDLDTNRQDFMSQEENYRQRNEECQRLQKEIAGLEHELGTMGETFTRDKSRVFDISREESQLNNQLGEKEEHLKKLVERKDRLLIRHDELKIWLDKYHSEHEALQGQIEHYQAELSAYDTSLRKMNEQKGALLEKVQHLEEEYTHLNQEGIKIKNSLLSLQEMNQNLSGYSVAVKSLMKAAASGKLKGIMGIPGEIIDVPRGLELAIDIAAGRSLENIVTDSVEHAHQAIDYLKAHKLGRVTFLPLNILKVQTVPGAILQQLDKQRAVIGLASRVVSYDTRYTKAVEYLLGRVLIVEDLDTAIHIFKAINYPLRIVSLEGDLLNASGAVSGGTKVSLSYGNSPLLRRGEEKRLLKEQKDNEIRRTSKHNELLVIRGELESLEEKIKQINQLRLESQMTLEVKNKQLNEVAAAVAAAREEMESFKNEAGEQELQMEKLQVETSNMQAQLSQMNQESQKASSQLENLKDEMEMKQRDLDIRKERFASQREQLEMKSRELDNIRKSVLQLEQVQLSYQQSVQEAHQVQGRMESENQQEKERQQELEQKIAEEQINLSRWAQEIAGLKKDYQTCNQNINDLRQKLIPKKERMEELQRQSHNLELAIARLETEQSSLEMKWKEKFSDYIDETSEMLSPGKMREYRIRIEQLQAQLEDLGLVDPESIREYEEVQERFSFLSQQYDDMLQARNTLSTLLGETENLMLKHFTHFLQLANESFNQTFKEIFDGGEACLKVESGKERLEAGVDIEVKLPGKRTQLLNLLSGGERALTCIAFIFSLLRLKPAPFCLLDEIDASLDETNLTRFARFLKAMSTSIQFIIITHRQATIEIGENIYGITMPEKGISSVLTLNLLEAESLAG
ncbi:MAG TPA: chromosome segregation protein SMC [Syntrophomonas sp.]|nr:chromosome segregation protein SMC [Syntrophomonas sp.]